MTEFKNILEAKKMEKGANLIGRVISVSAAKSGSSDKGGWTKQTATIKDNSGVIDIVMWNDDVGSLEQGLYYKFESLFWKTYKEELVPSFGKYTVVSRTTPEALVKFSMDGFSEPSEPMPKQANIKVLPTLTEKDLGQITSDTVLLMQIDLLVRNTMCQYMPPEAKIVDAQVGMYTKEIYRTLKHV